MCTHSSSTHLSGVYPGARMMIPAECILSVDQALTAFKEHTLCRHLLR